MSQNLPRPLFDAIYEINAAKNHADFVSAIVAGLGRLIAADLFTFHILDRKSQRLIERMVPDNPFTTDEVTHYRRHPEAFPLVAHYDRTGDTRARRITDVISRKAWLASSHYRNCLSRLGLQHVVTLPIQVDAHTVAGIAYNRTKNNFTKSDCALLDDFAPHFRLAWSRHPNPWKTSSRKPPDARSTKTLTPRETDVLYWITEGKQNREIATILGISLYTVQKHVANILRKLDVENRHALTVITLNQAVGR